MVKKGEVLMYQVGDLIIYGMTGVCEVTEITTIQMSGVPKDKLYYVLRPYYDNGSKIYSPVDNAKTVMRKIMTKEEAIELIDEIPKIKELTISNDKMCDDTYKEMIQSCESKKWVRVIKTSYNRKRVRLEQGKKSTATDERYFKLAKENLYSELAIPLSLSKDEVENYIKSKIMEKSKR